jgi:flagellar biosynthetic protein FliQ
MTPEFALDLTYTAIFTALKVAAPMLLTAVIIGVVVNILQTITSIKDMSLTFVPKVMGAAVVGGLMLPWTINVITGFFMQMFELFARVGTGTI